MNKEGKRKEVLLVKGMKKEVKVTRKQIVLAEGMGKSFSFSGTWE